MSFHAFCLQPNHRLEENYLFLVVAFFENGLLALLSGFVTNQTLGKTQTMQTADCRPCRPCRLQTEYFFSYSFLCIYFRLAHGLVLVTLISVQLYIGVFVYAQAALARLT